MFVSCMLTGTILGPTFLGRFDFMREVIFPLQNHHVLSAIGVIGVEFFLFLEAIKMDFGMVLKTGKKVMLMGVASVVIPFLCASNYYTKLQKEPFDNANTGLIFGIISVQSLSTFPVVSYILAELKITNSEIGRLVLSAALVSDIFGVSLLIGKTFIKGTATRDILGMTGFLIFTIFIFRPSMLWIIRKTPDGVPISSSYICLIIGIAFGAAMYLNEFNQGFYLGSIVLGFTIPAGSSLASSLLDKFESMTFGFFLPIQVATAMMRVDLFITISSIAKLILHHYLSLDFWNQVDGLFDSLNIIVQDALS